MRILYFSRSYTPHDRRFLRKIAEAGHAAFFLRLREDLRQESRPLPKGVRVVRWPGGGTRGEGHDDLLARVSRFGSVLRRVRPDVLHAGPVPTCGFLAALSGFRPLVVMSWGSDVLVDADRDAVTNAAARYALRRADRCVCDCATVRRKIQRLADVPGRKIVQFPWGVELDEFRPLPGASPLRRRLGWEDAFVVLSLRSWEPLYGIDVLLEAFRRLHRRHPRARLLLLGGGSQAPRVRRYLRRHRLEGAVHRPGPVAEDRLRDYFRAADVYISCAYSDGTSVSLLQALAAGLPAVLTDHPSNREWVRPGVNGWLARAGDAGAFGRALRSAEALDPAARARMRARNRERARKDADWDRNAGKLLAAYAALAPRKRSRRS